MSHNKQKWVIVFLVYADFRDHYSEIPTMSEKLKIHLNIMFKDIMKCRLNSEIARLFVVFQGIKYAVAQELGTDEMTILYEVREGKKDFRNYIYKSTVFGSKREGDANEEIDGIFEPNMQKQQKLGVILNKIEVQPDEEIFLMTWDHGSAFGIFKTSTAKEQTATAIPKDDNSKKNYRYLNLFWGTALKNKRLKEIVNEKKRKENIFIQNGGKTYKLLANQKDYAFPLELLRHQDNLNLFNVSKKNAGINLTLKRESLLNNKSLFTNTILDTHKKINEAKTVENEKPIMATKVHEILKNSELAEVICLWLKGKRKIGVLVMMNCCMMNMHTLYALKDIVKSLVAPQGFIDTPGYNYFDILKLIYTHTKTPLTFKNLARKTVKLSHNRFARERAKKIGSPPDTLEYNTFFAINLTGKQGEPSPFEQLLNKIKIIIKELKALIDVDDNNKIDANLVKCLRLVSFDFTGDSYYMVDFPNWVLTSFDLLKELDSTKYLTYGNAIQDEPNKFDLAYKSKNLIIEKFEGRKTYFSPTFGSNDYTLSLNNLTNRQQTGLSIFFPNKVITNNDKDIIEYVSSDLLLIKELENWKALLNKVYEATLF